MMLGNQYDLDPNLAIRFDEIGIGLTEEDILR